MRLSSRYVLLPALLVALTACSPKEIPTQPQEIEAGTSCSLDGMILADFPGPKGQIHYASGEPDFFCDTIEMFSIYLQPEQQKRITGIYTQDMAKTNWEKPENNWIDARQAYYVQGSSVHGSMGPTLASFATHEGAEAFVGKFGGKILRFDNVSLDMADLTGGAEHGQHM
ncbi:MAG: nitrous oxide reductase accessory protein NosL [Nitrosomonadales bacterium]|nr:nitrous oxide reductase accessory protein NosL [Nitrosomonadales bacterium]